MSWSWLTDIGDGPMTVIVSLELIPATTTPRPATRRSLPD
jgi:hypothetical protein